MLHLPNGRGCSYLLLDGSIVVCKFIVYRVPHHSLNLKFELSMRIHSKGLLLMKSVRVEGMAVGQLLRTAIPFYEIIIRRFEYLVPDQTSCRKYRHLQRMWESLHS